ncbi:peptide/nickel transport system permease protein [Sedimentibacter acidaminivorans]|uniref:Peptide/nickel transport system permease protein n=1 Tax=Sedimentibacter acidaminivorans TaxID=913099 RepID=A0ABS4GG07_9FIRM|nr:ABC transporter permease [Sedimentibacter acidaminivorans]MBP1926631.1 peptide/nickel transport system permease protein [Sedimentibacter acidaminivorans]
MKNIIEILKGIINIIKQLLKDPIGRIGFIGVFIIVLLSIFAPKIAPYDITEMFTKSKLVSPNGEFIFGTDNFGRDVFSRIIYGAKVSLQVGIISVGISATFGYIFGIVAGYFEGVVDSIIMRFMDVLFAFPSILLALFIVSVLGPSLGNTMIAIGIVNTPVFTRTVRASVISVKSMEYITSAKSIGLKPINIILKHITPNILAPFTVQATLALSGAILTEASLSFLGLGIQPPDPSWGSMLSESRKYMERAPWLAIAPAVFIICTILSFNILGDSLRDVLDPKLKL